jgi:Transposase DDE domain
MKSMTNYITEAKWVDVFLVWYVLIDEAYQKLEEKYGEWRRSGPAPVFSDSEVITVALIIDTYFHGHEALGLSFLRQYHAELFPHLPSDGHFNERRTRLGPLIEQIRCWLTKQEGLLDESDRVRLIDSAPIFVATYGRGGDNQTLAGHEYFGVATSHGAKVFGLRLDVTTSHDQVIEWMLAPASFHDSTTMPALVEEQNDLLLIGDGAYHNPTIEPVMSKNHHILVLAPPRQDSRLETWSEATLQSIARFRRPIESAFSVLATVFDIEHPLARSLHGLVSRLASRILAYTCSFVMSKYLAPLTG